MTISVEEIGADIARLRKMQSERAINIGVLRGEAKELERQRRELIEILDGDHEYNVAAMENNIKNLAQNIEHIEAVIRKEEAGIAQCDEMIGVLEEKKRWLSEMTSR